MGTKKKKRFFHQRLAIKTSQYRQVSMSLISSMISINTAGVHLSQGVFCYGHAITNHDPQHHTPNCALISTIALLEWHRSLPARFSHVSCIDLHLFFVGQGGWEESQCVPGKLRYRCTRSPGKVTEAPQQAKNASKEPEHSKTVQVLLWAGSVTHAIPQRPAATRHAG